MSDHLPIPPRLFEASEPIFPRRVHGYYRSLKWWLLGITLAIYYITPWLRWDRGPSLPDQAVLIDISGRRFYFFMIEIWPYEFYFVAGLLIMAGLGLFLFTSAVGRVWCGYACPQTVWTDLFILVERWVEGDRNARVRLWRQKYDLRKIRLRLEKWTIWLAISIATGGAWVFYFADAPQLLHQLLGFQAPIVAYGFIAALTATTFVFGGFMREQICIYMCPWPRIQAAMMDEETLTVAYRDWRGEPRGKKHENTGGDCIDCMACVNVCPMGIDIRDGQQLACITCALCIDACDDVMAKIDKPRGLIDYCSLSDEQETREGNPPKSILQHILRARTMIYIALWSGVGISLVVALFVRPNIDISVAPVRNPLFVTMSDGSVRNSYEIHLRNKHAEDRAFQISVKSATALGIALEGTPDRVVTVPADSTANQRLYLTAQPGSTAATLGSSGVRFWVADLTNGDRTNADSTFHGTGK